MSTEEIRKEHKKISEGLDQAFAKVIAFKKQKNTPLVISRDGKVIEIPAQDLSD